MRRSVIVGFRCAGELTLSPLASQFTKSSMVDLSDDGEVLALSRFHPKASSRPSLMSIRGVLPAYLALHRHIGKVWIQRLGRKKTSKKEVNMLH